jgi:hypothetical protein
VNNGNSSFSVPIVLGEPLAKADWLTAAGLWCTVELTYDDVAIKKVLPPDAAPHTFWRVHHAYC